MSTSAEKIADPVLLQEAEQAVTKFGFSPLKLTAIDHAKNCFYAMALNKSEKKVELFLKFTPAKIAAPTAAIDRQRWLSEQLLANGFKQLPKYYTTADQSSLLLQNEKSWICQSYFKSTSNYEWLKLDCSPQHAFQAGQTLASVHNAGAKLLRKRSDLVGFNTWLRILNEFQANFARNSQEIHQSRTANQAGLESIQKLNFERLQKKADLLVQDLIKLESATARKTVNHGDYHPGNILFGQNGVQAVIDWDYVCIGGGIYDLCYGLFMFTLKTAKEAKADRELFDSRKTECFLNGYNPGTSTVKNMQSLNLCTEFIHLLMLNWACEELCRPVSVCSQNPDFDNLLTFLSYCHSA